MKRFLLPIVLLGLCLFPAIVLGQTCPSLPAMVDLVLPPQVGDSAALGTLLQPAIASPQLSDAFNLSRVRAALEDLTLRLDSSSCDPPDAERRRPLLLQFLGRFLPLLRLQGSNLENCTYRNLTGSELRTKGKDGRYAYVNPARSHQGTQANAIDQRTAANKTLQALLALGVPQAEIDVDSQVVRDVNLYAQNLGASGPIGQPTIVRAEVHPLFHRRVADTLVWDSFGRAAIDVQGRIARLHVRWPDFCIAPGVSANETLTRQQVLNAVVARVAANNPCELIGRVGARLAYVAVDQLDQPLSAAAGTEDDEGENDACFLPAVMIAVFGPEAAENSGQLSLGGELVAIPLFAPPTNEPPTGPIPQ